MISLRGRNKLLPTLLGVGQPKDMKLKILKEGFLGDNHHKPLAGGFSCDLFSFTWFRMAGVLLTSLVYVTGLGAAGN